MASSQVADVVNR